ncbi:hypothetical protein H131_10033 [Lysinibacillus sphaericus OT4b.31]|uniref:Uncharacterized protein n=1 Tax=Lysinibacillus sphaericus OT4b.31 TaxID=1285586 RepID=R7ZEB4_LYSSH|nr:hypothetical protein H131_10033 [Lysinibacillus sphaericus OT4b.31]
MVGVKLGVWKKRSGRLHHRPDQQKAPLNQEPPTPQVKPPHQPRKHSGKANIYRHGINNKYIYRRLNT